MTIDFETQTALATDIIAVFTIMLAIVGTCQAWLMHRTMRLARDEFISTHRPKIIIHTVESALDVIDTTDDITIGALVVYFNTGSTSAKITEISCRVTRRRLPLQSGIFMPANGLAPVGKVEPGGRGAVRVTSDMRLDHERVRQQELLREGYVVPNGSDGVRIEPRSDPNGAVVAWAASPMWTSGG